MENEKKKKQKENLNTLETINTVIMGENGRKPICSLAIKKHLLLLSPINIFPWRSGRSPSTKLKLTGEKRRTLHKSSAPHRGVLDDERGVHLTSNATALMNLHFLSLPPLEMTICKFYKTLWALLTALNYTDVQAGVFHLVQIFFSIFFLLLHPCFSLQGSEWEPGVHLWESSCFELEQAHLCQSNTKSS